MSVQDNESSIVLKQSSDNKDDDNTSKKIVSTTESIKKDTDESAINDCEIKKSINNSDNVATTTAASVVIDSKIVRSESVIKSPTKSSSSSITSSPTPVIQVTVDTSTSQNSNAINSSGESTLLSTTNICKPSSQSSLFSSSTSTLSSTNYFLHQPQLQMSQPDSITPNNPFLRATTFQSQSSNNSSMTNSEKNNDSDSSESNQIIFAPPKLIPSSSLFSSQQKNNETNLLMKPSVLKTSSNSNIEDLKKPNETISASKLFISLDKDAIGTIKTPSFIKMNRSNGSTIGNAKDGEDSETGKSTENESSTPTFLFGQKLEDRVVFDSTQKSSSSSHKMNNNDNLKSSLSDPSTSSSATTITKSSDLNLFSFSDYSKCEDDDINNSKSDDLSDKQIEQMECKNNGDSESVFKRKYEVITGEEDEQNVLTIYGKLYAWDPQKESWVEKGRGHLRLNDVMKNDKLCSRLVMRTAGALRLILNAHIVSGMTFELAMENCLRFTYVDGIYMIKGNSKEIDQLHSAIEHRLRELSWKRNKATTSDNNNNDSD